MIISIERIGTSMPTKLFVLLMTIVVSSTQLLASPPNKLLDLKPDKLKFVAGKIKLPSGTQVNVYADFVLSSENAFLSGETNFTVSESIIKDGKILIAAGAIVKARITKTNKRMWGKPGKLIINAYAVKSIDGQFIPLRGNPVEIIGKKRAGLAIGLSIGIGIFTAGLGLFIGFFVKGREAISKPGVIDRSTTRVDAEIESK